MWLRRRGGGHTSPCNQFYIDFTLATAGYIGYSWLLSPAEGSLVGVIQETHSKILSQYTDLLSAAALALETKILSDSPVQFERKITLAEMGRNIPMLFLVRSTNSRQLSTGELHIIYPLH